MSSAAAYRHHGSRRAALSTDGKAAQALGSWSNRRSSAVPENPEVLIGPLSMIFGCCWRSRIPFSLPETKRLARRNQRIVATPMIADLQELLGDQQRDHVAVLGKRYEAKRCSARPSRLPRGSVSLWNSGKGGEGVAYRPRVRTAYVATRLSPRDARPARQIQDSG